MGGRSCRRWVWLQWGWVGSEGGGVRWREGRGGRSEKSEVDYAALLHA